MADRRWQMAEGPRTATSMGFFFCDLPSAICHLRYDGAMANRIAVVGGGINGAGAACELVRRDYEVVLFEKGVCGAQTSSATTKMIHGGLRYLEHLQVGL